MNLWCGILIGVMLMLLVAVGIGRAITHDVTAADEDYDDEAYKEIFSRRPSPERPPKDLPRPRFRARP